MPDPEGPPHQVPAPLVMQRLSATQDASGNWTFEQAPGAGIVHLRMIGAAAVVNVQFAQGGATAALNAGAALTSGAMYEFEFAVDRGESIFIAVGPTGLAAFWRPGT